jgi:putative aldouronate transport system substrate-binding protein
MWPDSPITTEFVDNTMKQRLMFSYVSGSEYGVETAKSDSMGFKIYALETVKAQIKSSQAAYSGLGIPYTAEEPEAAMRFIDLLYTDSTLMDLVVRGVEGVDYELVDGQVKYPEEEHYSCPDYLLGNNYLLTPMYGNDADYYAKVKEANDTAPVSPYMGFALDITGLDDLIANLGAVNGQYRASFTGGLYTDELYQEYLDKLYAAGVQEYLDNVQDQLSAWLDANK